MGPDSHRGSPRRRCSKLRPLRPGFRPLRGPSSSGCLTPASRDSGARRRDPRLTEPNHEPRKTDGGVLSPDPAAELHFATELYLAFQGRLRRLRRRGSRVSPRATGACHPSGPHAHRCPISATLGGPRVQWHPCDAALVLRQPERRSNSGEKLDGVECEAVPI